MSDAETIGSLRLADLWDPNFIEEPLVLDLDEPVETMRKADLQLLVELAAEALAARAENASPEALVQIGHLLKRVEAAFERLL